MNIYSTIKLIAQMHQLCIQGRGSSRKGHKHMHAVYGKLGSVEVQDQIEVMKKLQQEMHFIDPDRIAIWGWVI